MIEVTVRMIPGGDQEKAYDMSQLTITNITPIPVTPQARGRYNAQGNYEAVLYRVEQVGADHPHGNRRIWKTARIMGFRRSKFSVWYLVCIALVACLGKRTIDTYDSTVSLN